MPSEILLAPRRKRSPQSAQRPQKKAVLLARIRITVPWFFDPQSLSVSVLRDLCGLCGEILLAPRRKRLPQSAQRPQGKVLLLARIRITVPWFFGPQSLSVSVLRDLCGLCGEILLEIPLGLRPTVALCRMATGAACQRHRGGASRGIGKHTCTFRMAILAR
jgi:hypothetical protein